MTTAFRLFLKKSYKAVTLREIIAESGFSNGAFYHYFKSKEELFEQIADYYWLEMMNLPFTSPENRTLYQFIQDALDRSKEIFEWINSEVILDGETSYFYSFIFEAYRIIPGFADKTFASQQKELALWSTVIKNARRNGEIRSELTNENLAQHFITLSYGNAVTRLINQDISDMNAHLRSAWEGLYFMLKI